MKRIIISMLCFLLNINIVYAQGKVRSEIEKSIETLKQLMIDPDKSKLEVLLSDYLTYGHSNGLVENKTQCIENFMSGTSDFVDIMIDNQQHEVVGKTAWSRYDLFAHTNNKGVAGETKLKVLLVWVKKANGWKLLARQAVRIPM